MIEPTWCPDCGPDVVADEDGCCSTCGCQATGQGARGAQEFRSLVRSLVDKMNRNPHEGLLIGQASDWANQARAALNHDEGEG